MGKPLIDTTKYPKLLPGVMVFLCCIQPILDAASYWQAELGVNVMLLPRAILLVVIALLGFAVSQKKLRYVALFAVLGLLFAAHTVACRKNGYVGWLEDLSNYIRVLQLPITTFSLISCLKAQEKCFDALLAGLFGAFCVVVGLQLLAVITGTEPYTYPDKQIGLRGWCFWPNAQSAILSVLSPCAICYALRRWKKSVWQVALVSVIAFAMLFLHGTRLAYACLMVTAVGVFLTVLLCRLPKKYLPIFLALIVVFACLLPVSPMLKNQQKVAENAVRKGRIFEDLVSIGERQAEEKQQQNPEAYTQKQYALDRLAPAYEYYMPGLVSRFGMEKVAQAYDGSEDISVIANERTWKLTYCKLLMQSSTTRLSRFFGLNVSDMTEAGLSHDCENDIHAVYYLYGNAGLLLLCLFLGYFLLRILLALLRRPKQTFTWETACIGIALLTLLVHSYFTCGVLRRSNTLFYFGAVLALLYACLAQTGGEKKPSRLKAAVGRIDGGKKTLFKNTLMLYVLQGSAMLLALVAVPYETRILGVGAYGLVGAATAIMVYFQLVVDFGFLLSATEAVSRNRKDTAYLSRMLTSVTLCKLLLSAASFGVLLLLCRLIPAWQTKQPLLLLFFVSTVFTSFMPDYMYRGIEKMTAIAVRTVIIRAFFTAAVFVLLKKPEDIYYIPVLNIIGNGIAMLAAYFDLGRRFSIRLCRVKAREIGECFRQSSVFFASRFATTFYTALNTVILDAISANGVKTSLYTSADKLLTTGKNLLTPVSDSLYPYMTAHKDFKLVKRVLLVIMPVIILFCTGCFIWAEELCAFLFGAEFAQAGRVLRAMLPVGVVILPSYLLGYPTLTAMGLSKYANLSVIFGTAVHLINLAILYFTGNMNMVTLGMLLSVAETVIMIFRAAVIFKHRDRLRPPKEEMP